jgi:hypothetical protein
MATVLEKALTEIYAVWSVKVNTIITENISKPYADSQIDSILCSTFDIYMHELNFFLLYTVTDEDITFLVSDATVRNDNNIRANY